MNYSEQQRFLAGFQTRWLAAGSAMIVLASLALRDLNAASVAFVFLITGCAISLSYLPKYLHMHHEPEKRYGWAIRCRWILTLALVLVTVAFNFTRLPILVVVTGAGLWLALVNGFAMITFRSERVLSYRWMPVVYFASDFWLISVLAYLGLEPFLLAGFLATSLVFALLLNVHLGPWFPLAGMALSAALLRTAILPAAYGFSSSFLIFAVALAAGATSWLCGLTLTQARKNYERTLADLTAFTGMDLATAEERFLSSRQMLVEAWRDANLDEQDKEGLARWYADNSLSYLFDTARFHLNYKHIAFSLDVLKLSRGRCLDYGAGNGALALEMARRGMLVTYFDVPGSSRDYAEWKAAQEDLALYFTSSKDEIRAQDLYFDTIVSLDVLEHVPDLAGELEYLSGLMVPGGRLIMTVPVGATETHPMHLSHDVRTVTYLEERGLRDIKGWKLRLAGSEILRKRDCVIMEKSATAITASVSGGSTLH